MVRQLPTASALRGSRGLSGRAAAALAVSLHTLMLLACAGPASPAPSPARLAPRVVYFVPARPANTQRQPFSFAEWRAKGAVLVHRFEDLRAAAGPETEVIVFDDEVRQQVDPEWLRAQLRRRGRTIVGINVNHHDLQAMLDDSQPWTTPWDPPGPMFSIKSWGDTCASGGQDEFRNTRHPTLSPIDAFLLGRVQATVDCARK